MGWIFAYIFFIVVIFVFCIIFLRNKILKDIKLYKEKIETYLNSKFSKKINLKKWKLKQRKRELSDGFGFNGLDIMELIVPILGVGVILMVGFSVAGSFKDAMSGTSSTVNISTSNVLDDLDLPMSPVYLLAGLIGIGILILGFFALDRFYI